MSQKPIVQKASECKSCHATIVYFKLKPTFENPAPKSAPINRFPEPNGNLLLDWDKMTYSAVKKADLPKARELGMKLHLSHFASCGSSRKYRGK